MAGTGRPARRTVAARPPSAADSRCRAGAVADTRCSAAGTRCPGDRNGSHLPAGPAFRW